MNGQLAISEAILHKTNLLSISSILNLVQHSNDQEHSLAAIHIQKCTTHLQVWWTKWWKFVAAPPISGTPIPSQQNPSDLLKPRGKANFLKLSHKVHFEKSRKYTKMHRFGVSIVEFLDMLCQTSIEISCWINFQDDMLEIVFVCETNHHLKLQNLKIHMLHQPQWFTAPQVNRSPP